MPARKIDKTKLLQICEKDEKLKEQIDWIREKVNGKDLFEASDQLGDWIDGWKIQGYWYEDFVKFLYACADSMEGLTKDNYDNYIEMEEEQGYKFTIYFYLEDGKPKVEVGYVPMEYLYMDLDRTE